MTPAVDHPAAAHDAVAPIGVIRAAIVASVIGRTEADRETRREAPTEPPQPQSPWPRQPPCQPPPCHLASAVPGRAAVAAATAMTAAAAMAILRSDIRIAAPPHQQPERSMTGDETRSVGTGSPAGGVLPMRGAAPVPRCRSARAGHPWGTHFEGSVRCFWRRNTSPTINRCDPPHSITVRPRCIIRPENG